MIFLGTTEDGKGLNYDVIVYPKSNTAYGTITLTKQNENGVKLNGVTFILQKKNGENWVNYPDDTKAVLQTNSVGQITVDKLPVGDYRFVETDLGSNAGYILDNQTAYTFNVSLDNTSTTVVEPSSITVTNQKPTLNKVIALATRDSDDTNSIKDGTNSLDIGDTATYTITADVPTTIARLTTYKINDTMDAGLTFSETGFEIKGVKSDSSEDTLTKNTDYTLTSTAQSFEVNFTNANLANYKTLKLTYNAVLNTNADATSTGNKNSATLTYSTIVTTNYKSESNTNATSTTDPKTVTVYTGGLQIEKRENTRTGALLDGAVFKIATTKTNAEAKTFIKDADGNEITLTTADGKVSYKGLSYGTYYLVEVQAPSYTDGTETKYYNLLNKPVEITVDSTTYGANANIVINRKPTALPLTGAQGGIIVALAGCILVITGLVISRKKENK